MALVVSAKRDLLLRVHRHRLRREDLEDCFSQAVLELVSYARNGASFASRAHLANVIEQRFLSRVHDRRRALSGRSPMQAALETAVPLGDLEQAQVEIVDTRADPELLTILRQELGRVQACAQDLSPDQQLVLASQIALQMGCTEFCDRFCWSAEKYRKVAQRARSRLRELLAEEIDVPSTTRPSDGVLGTPYDHSSPAHSRVPWDADSRLYGRLCGESPPRASGRGPASSRLWLSAARVHASETLR